MMKSKKREKMRCPKILEMLLRFKIVKVIDRIHWVKLVFFQEWSII